MQDVVIAATAASVPVERPMRRVALVNVSWSEPDRGARGALELRLRDEDGEYVLQAAPDDVHALEQFLTCSREVLFDLGYGSAGLASWVPPSCRGTAPVWAEASLMHT